MIGAILIDHDNLDAFVDPANYDQEDQSDVGVAFYTGLARETGGPVLELACGTGRVCIPIAQEGFAVTGLDIVPGMVERARSKSAGLPARWIEGDGRTFDLGEKFNLIFLTGNAFQAFLTNADQQALLQRVHAHLQDEGLFAFETRNPLFPGAENPQGLFVPLETIEEEQEWPSFTDTNGREVRVYRTWKYDHTTQIHHCKTYKRWREDGEEQTQIVRVALRYIFPQELAALLHYNGFDIDRQYGDWNLEPLGAKSRSIISVCRKKQ